MAQRQPQSLLPEAKIAKPKEGRFTFVVMGAPPEDSFPEASGVLSCRVAYSVPLQIGTRPDWTMFYCLPPSGPPAASKARLQKVEAPYPYLMFRPVIEFGTVERILVQGFVNTVGRLERTRVIGTEISASVSTLLEAMERWEFRPGTVDGQPARFEVLIVVPRPEI